MSSSAPDRVLPLINSLRAVSEAKILLLTRLEDDQAIILGASGLIDRNASREQLFSALEKVSRGEVWLDRAATGRIFVEFSRTSGRKSNNSVADKANLLTSREREVVVLIVSNSASGKVVANKLDISESTLRNHLSSIYEKLGVSNRPGLLAYAFQNRLIKYLLISK